MSGLTRSEIYSAYRKKNERYSRIFAYAFPLGILVILAVFVAFIPIDELFPRIAFGLLIGYVVSFQVLMVGWEFLSGPAPWLTEPHDANCNCHMCRPQHGCPCSFCGRNREKNLKGWR